ncbi:MAG: hypothetical protein ACLFTK_14360 [Anaerolineales bacterium]
MDGILGVGFAEIIIIVLVILIIGGPQNAVKWSRDLGRLLRQGRDLFAKLMREFDKEMGDEGRQIMKATREFGQSINEVRQQSNPRRLLGEAGKRLIEEPYEETKQSLQEADRKAHNKHTPPAEPNPKAAKPQETKKAKPGQQVYSAWLPGSENADAPRYDAWLPDQQKTEDH